MAKSLPPSHLPFDDFFSAFYGTKEWSNIRKGLESNKVSCALINRYSTINENLFPADQYRRFESLCTPKMTVMEPIDSENCPDVPRPINHSHYPMCAASLLAVRALDIQPNDQILDLCASPGGKSIAICQNFESTNHLTSNEMSQERFERLKQTLKSYIPATAYRQQIRLTNLDGTRAQIWTKTFDKILIDAPCSSERHLVSSSSTQMWSVKRSKMNGRRQLSLLRTAMRCVKPQSGTIVYSTCSISPFENDLVIEQFLQEFKGRVQIFKQNFPFGSSTEHGWMVFPKPWGPFYLCVLSVRVEDQIDFDRIWKNNEDSSSSDEEEQ